MGEIKLIKRQTDYEAKEYRTSQEDITGFLIILSMEYSWEIMFLKVKLLK